MRGRVRSDPEAGPGEFHEGRTTPREIFEAEGREEAGRQAVGDLSPQDVGQVETRDAPRFGQADRGAIIIGQALGPRVQVADGRDIGASEEGKAEGLGLGKSGGGAPRSGRRLGTALGGRGFLSLGLDGRRLGLFLGRLHRLPPDLFDGRGGDRLELPDETLVDIAAGDQSVVAL